MFRLSLFFLIPCFFYVSNLSAQRGCCDNNYNAGNKALIAKNYSEAIRFFTQGIGCGDKCNYDFAALIKQVKNGGKTAGMAKIKPKPESSTPSVSTPFVAPQMVKVDGGTFQMGSDAQSDEKPLHSVTVSDFYIGKYEVTQAEWQSIMGKNPSVFKGTNLPVENVSWNDVQDFLQKINAKTSKKYRLPTEAEWEFAARGGNKSNGYIYSGSNDIESIAWYSKNSNNKTHDVGQRSANELGIYDMSGNVWEWCQDLYRRYPNSNDISYYDMFSRVFRGGVWNLNFGACRSTFRRDNMSVNPSNDLGFRLAISSLH